MSPSLQKRHFHFSFYLPHTLEKTGKAWLTFPMLQDRFLWLVYDKGILASEASRWLLGLQVEVCSSLLHETSRLVDGSIKPAQDIWRL